MDTTQPAMATQQQIRDFARAKAQKALTLGRELEVMRLATIEPVISEMVISAKSNYQNNDTHPLKKELVSS